MDRDTAPLPVKKDLLFPDMQHIALRIFPCHVQTGGCCIYGILQDDESLPKEERALYAVMRNGTKLILNSASGAADANFESNIRMNNKIISMRIIGQLFTWRIGQAQTLEGASPRNTQ